MIILALFLWLLFCPATHFIWVCLAVLALDMTSDKAPRSPKN